MQGQQYRTGGDTLLVEWEGRKAHLRLYITTKTGSPSPTTNFIINDSYFIPIQWKEERRQSNIWIERKTRETERRKRE